MAVQKRTSKNVLLDTALKNFYAAAEEMNLDEGLVEVLSRSERAVCVSVPVVMDDGSVRVFDGFMALESNGRAYKPGITEQVITIDEFIKEYSALCVVKVMDIREVMSFRN